MKTKFLLSVLFIAFLGFVNSVSAQDNTKWDKNHPRRAEVNSRLKKQNERIDKKEADGKMSAKEADKLHKEDHSIRKEEKSDAKKDGGHITKGEQRKLNRQENHVNRQIVRH